MVRFTIRAYCDRHDEPATDAKVSIDYFDGASDSQWTNTYGRADFSLPSGHECRGTVYIRGSVFRDYRFYSGREVTFHVRCNKCG